MNKALTVFAIIGSASAANTLLRDQGTTLYYQKFPSYTTNAAAMVSDLLYITLTYTTTGTLRYGGYQCIRAGGIYAFPQFVTNAAQTNVLSTVSNTLLVTFYGADTLGATLGVAAGTVAEDTNAASNAVFINHGCSKRIGSPNANAQTTVQAGFLVTILTLIDGGSTIIANRPFYMGPHNEGINPVNMAALTGNTIYTWNNDFLLASTWQQGPNATVSPASATDFCTKNYSALDTATAEYAASATGVTGSGFSSKSKCTWQVKVKEAIGAPAFSVIAAKTTAFQLQWAEWEAGVLTAKTDLVDTTNAAPFYPGISTNLGADAQWPNPINTYTLLGAAQSTTNVAGDLMAYTDYDPEVNGYAGSPGMVKYYPTSNLTTATILSVESYSTMDYMAVKGQYDDYNSQASTYNTSKDSYNTLKDAYNKQVKAEKERLADFFKAIFEPVTVIPERPCQPTRLAAIYAVDMDYTSTAAISLDSKKANKAVFTFDSVGQSVNASWRVGYLVASSSTTLVTTDYVGHVYGLLGQDIAQVTNLSEVAADTKKDLRAWQWKDAAADKAHYQMVSILPYELNGMTTLTASDSIGVTFTVVAFDTARKITKPGQPDATSAPDAAIGANALAASAVAVAAVAASLF